MILCSSSEGATFLSTCNASPRFPLPPHFSLRQNCTLVQRCFVSIFLFLLPSRLFSPAIIISSGSEKESFSLLLSFPMDLSLSVCQHLCLSVFSFLSRSCSWFQSFYSYFRFFLNLINTDIINSSIFGQLGWVKPSGTLCKRTLEADCY